MLRTCCGVLAAELASVFHNSSSPHGPLGIPHCDCIYKYTTSRHKLTFVLPLVWNIPLPDLLYTSLVNQDFKGKFCNSEMENLNIPRFACTC